VAFFLFSSREEGFRPQNSREFFKKKRGPPQKKHISLLGCHQFVETNKPSLFKNKLFLCKIATSKKNRNHHQKKKKK
jgi:hypothetical protein